MAPAGTAFTRDIHEIVAQTVDDTPTTVLSIPISEEKVVYAAGLIMCFTLTLSAGAIARAETAFVRRAGANITRSAAPRLDLIRSTFGNPQPALDLVATIGTQSIDVVVTGKAGQTLRWHVSLTVDQTA